MPKIAICFFGITRSLSDTYPSIDKNIIKASKHFGDVKVFSHLFNQRTLNSKRSREVGSISEDEHLIIPHDWLEFDEPDTEQLKAELDSLLEHGDAFNDNGTTLRNLVHQLYSIDQACEAALNWNPDIVIFARPDLKYHDSFFDILQDTVAGFRSHIWIPDWQHWNGGYNDRFAVCRGKKSIKAYGQRRRVAVEFCVNNATPLDPENLVRYSIEKSGVATTFVRNRASRMRLGGNQRKESFMHYKLHYFWQKIMAIYGPLVRLIK